MLHALAPDMHPRLTAPERLALMGDEWALVRAGRHSVADYLTLAAGLGKERTSGVFGEIARRLTFIHDYLTTDDTRPRFEQFVRDLLRPALAELGLAAAAGEADDRRTLRPA
jgi:hypothetical protein